MNEQAGKSRIAHSVAILMLAAGMMSACSRTRPPVHIAPTAPPDAPLAGDSSGLATLDQLLEPCRRRAMESYGGARARFLSGLPPRQSMFIVTRLHDPAGRREQVFVAVDAIDGDRVTGRIWNDLHVVQGYRRGEVVTVPQGDIVDWMISRPDGTEEGNLMGKFIDALQATGRPPTGICTQ